MDKTPKKFTNSLISETSPYLLQHAHNPVNWQAWNEEVLLQAKKENKLLLISIGYAACHWCHVMEHECFEDEEVAKTMNTHFINIKVDREERPDVDHIYMDALQMMTGSGGWPLNIVALPNGKPFWGATYVKKEDWIQVLEKLAELFKKDAEKTIEYAEKLSDGIKAINLVDNKPDLEIYSLDQIESAIKDWSQYFDTFLGGYKRAPKFMMPVNLNFLLHYSTSQKDATVLEYVNTSLTRMAWGGLFDQIGGGFSRYSVDTKWHIPHFEKMLYDNGQLISLYAQAYAVTKNELYKSTVDQTITFIEKELMNEDYGFYSSLDADSLDSKGKLEEGAFYVWKEDQLKQILKEDYNIFKDYFNINKYGYWEDGNYVLIRDATNEDVAKKHDISTEKLEKVISDSRNILFQERNNRSRPRLDDKILTSWNGLMLKGLTDAYRYLENESYLILALKNAQFVLEHLKSPDGGLFHNYKNGKSTINGYLEDYAAVIDAFIGLYEVTFDEKWLFEAKNLTDYSHANFFDIESKMFFFSSKKVEYVIRRTVEVGDNVIPASNSIMGVNLFKLAKYFPKEGYQEITLQMLKNVQENLHQNPQNHANWLHLNLFMQKPFYEIAIVGKDFESKGTEIRKKYLPNTIISGTSETSTILLLQNRNIENETLLYICQENLCKLPANNTEEVLTQISQDS